MEVHPKISASQTKLLNQAVLVLVGLQLLLVNALEPIIRGEAMSQDWYNNLTRQVRESKYEATKVVIEKHLTNRQKSSPA